MAGTDHSILEQAADWLNQGRKLAIATVVETWGSAPQPVGSQLVVVVQKGDELPCGKSKRRIGGSTDMPVDFR